MGLIRKIVFGILMVVNRLIFKINGVTKPYPDVHGILLVYNKGKMSVGKLSRINSFKFKNIIGGDTRSSVIVKKGAELVIGENFKMSNSAIYCANKIEIGDNVMVGGSCKLWDSDFHPLNSTDRLNNPNEDYATRPIKIGNDVFIGGFSIILKGVTVGDGAIVGAGSVVSKNIPAGEIWAGNPATFVKKA